ncbi:galactose ABC transporter substrate-binding protein [Clostridium chromiireducens]|uniref:D-galactose/methyl-galactoside binding periplasmic protein MglB n=1 Tax=Clostridium chromiireducens TaxID=225345 RepID=A0A1V4IRS9_9CLOT|nr:galactose ABC transporter substrate-binding protein [Clostridium chromiireducens]OPJ62504.1 D-galactose-binding periplasmic protein precursor [Clostridium chromiireducens]
MKTFKKLISFLLFTIVTTILTTNFINNVYATSILNNDYRKIANIAILLRSFDDPFEIQLKENLEDIQLKNKDKMTFTFYDGKNNSALQTETLSSLVNHNIDLFIIIPANPSEDLVKDIIIGIKQKNIPLILIGISPQIVSSVYKDYNKVAFFSENTGEISSIQGEILINLWNTNRSILDKNNDNIMQYVLLQGKSNNPVAIERTNNVITTINNSGIKTEQLALVNADWSQDIAKTSIENLFLRYGTRIEAIISNNDAMAIGAIEALQKYGYNKGDKTKNIAVVGIDGLPEAKDLINKGLMTGTVIQDVNFLANALYTIGMNLINKLSPIENTNFKLLEGEIITPQLYQEYIKK